MTQAGSIAVLSGILAMGSLMGCGVVGSPIPPENVGVAPTIARQKQAHDRQSADQKLKIETPVAVEDTPLVPVGQDEELPPLRPVGTR